MNNQVKVLIAEDDAVSRKLQKIILEKNKYQVIEASDGQSAWGILQDTIIDLVVLDLSMPGMDGIELLTKIKQSPLLKKIPVIICSSSSQPDVIGKAVSLEITGFVLKPIEAKSFLKKIRDAEKKIIPVFEDPVKTIYKLGIEYRDLKELVQTMVEDSKKKLKGLGRNIEKGNFDEFEQFCKDVMSSADNFGAAALKNAAEEARIMIKSSENGAKEKYLFNLRGQLEKLKRAVVNIQ